MKGKPSRKIIVGVSIPVLFIILWLYVYPEMRYYNYLSNQRKAERIEKEMEEEYKKTLEEYRSLNPDEFLVFLKNNYQYFLHEDPDDKVNYLYELTIENKVPVLFWIDFYNGEKIIRDKIIFDNRSDELRRYYFNWNDKSKGYYYHYEYKFYTWGHNEILCIKDNGVNRLYEIIQSGKVLKPYKTRKIENILLELSKRITATHRQYAGEYAYQNIEIIYDNKNEYDPNEIEGPKGITITCTDTGNLRALFKFDSPRDDYEYDFFIYDNSKNEIEYSYWDGHAASGSTKYYIENDYIINHFENSTGYSEEESGYTVAYKIYYKKRTNRS